MAQTGNHKGLIFGIFLAPFHRVGENPTLGMARDMELIEWLDELGFDEAWIGEHHSAGWETISAPEVFMGAAIDPAMMDEHLDRMLKHLYVEIDATEAQKQQLAPIVKAAAHDLLPMRTQFQDARRQAIDLLSRERVDRAALEALRADQLRLAEQASVRFTQALADMADVLTPAQRKQLAERVGRWHGRRG